MAKNRLYSLPRKGFSGNHEKMIFSYAPATVATVATLEKRPAETLAAQGVLVGERGKNVSQPVCDSCDSWPEGRGKRV